VADSYTIFSSRSRRPVRKFWLHRRVCVCVYIYVYLYLYIYMYVCWKRVRFYSHLRIWTDVHKKREAIFVLACG